MLKINFINWKSNQNQTETDVVATVVRVVAVAVRNTAVPGVAAPTAAAKNEIDALWIKPGSAILRRAFIAAVPMVVAPLPRIAAHIV